MTTQTATIEPGARVRVRNTRHFDDRTGVIIPASEHPNDFWDWCVQLDSDGTPGREIIGVMIDQVEVLDSGSVTATAPATRRDLVPGIYRGGSPAEYGLWRLTDRGVWLFCMPVAGATWKRSADQDPGYDLIMLVDETRI